MRKHTGKQNRFELYISKLDVKQALDFQSACNAYLVFVVKISERAESGESPD